MPLLDLPQRSPEWKAARVGKITASLAAAVLGLDPYCSPFSAFMEITGRKVRKENNDMRRGTQGEPDALKEYEVESGNLVTPTGLWVHDELPWLAASPDGLVGGDGLVEIKCPRGVPVGVPPHHRVQMEVQMACANRAWCDYFAYSLGGHLRCRVERDSLRELDLLSGLGEFYRDHIQPDKAPPRRRKKKEPTP